MILVTLGEKLKCSYRVSNMPIFPPLQKGKNKLDSLKLFIIAYIIMDPIIKHFRCASLQNFVFPVHVCVIFIPDIHNITDIWQFRERAWYFENFTLNIKWSFINFYNIFFVFHDFLIVRFIIIRFVIWSLVIRFLAIRFLIISFIIMFIITRFIIIRFI